MNDLQRFKQRLERSVSRMPPNSANKEHFLAKINELYIAMLEEQVARGNDTVIRRPRVRTTTSKGTQPC